jgi:hypothetical protein
MFRAWARHRTGLLAHRVGILLQESLNMNQNLASQDLATQNELGLKYDPRKFIYYAPNRQPFRPDEQPEEAEVKPLSEVPYRPVAWIWNGRIPCNKLTLIEGPAESGKSLVAIDLVARLTRGAPMPGETEPDQELEQVVILSRQDDLHDTILPRIRRAGGSLDAFSNFSNIGRRKEEDDEVFEKRRGLKLPADFQFVEEAMEFACGHMLLVDPLANFCRSAQDFQRTIELLDDLASRMSIPILATLPARTSRNTHGTWVTRPAYPDDPARCVWSIHADPDDPRRRFFLPTRMTFATAEPGMAFRIEEGRIAWEPLPDLSIPEYDDTVAWLLNLLLSGELRSRVIEKLARDFDITPSMLRRAKKVLKVKPRREGFGPDMVCYWTLPEDRAGLPSIPSVIITTANETAARLEEGEKLKIAN